MKRIKKSPYILRFLPPTLAVKSSVVFFRISINCYFIRKLYLYCHVSFASFIIITSQFPYIVLGQICPGCFNFFISFINLLSSKVPLSIFFRRAV